MLFSKSKYTFYHFVLFFTSVIFLFSFSNKDIPGDRKIRITILQINDVYEIVALDEGKSGGLARVASIRNQLKEENPGTLFTVLAGDFLSPSAIGTLTDSAIGSIGGLQMVDVLNKTGVDLVTFGNHEFDLKKPQLEKCINRSNFQWVSSNTFDSVSSTQRQSFMKREGDKSSPIPEFVIKKFTDKRGTTVKIGLFGLTIRSGAGKYAGYDDYKTAAAKAIRLLKGKCDFIIALTHLSLDLDKKLAADFPEIKMILGGHEHINSYDYVGKTVIAKADANAKTVYIHELEFNKASRKVSISSRLVTIDKEIKEDTDTKNMVDHWNDLADRLLKKKFRPCHTIATLPIPFDGTEKNIRTDTTNLTLAIGKAMMEATKDKNPVCAIYNSGAVRIDDLLKDDVTEYDVFRVMPYSDSIFVAGIPGSWIDTLLIISDSNKRDGCFLQHNGSITKENNKWLINGRVINKDSVYNIAINGYLLKGGQDKMNFLGTRDKKLYTDAPVAADTLRTDIRRAVMHYLTQVYPPKSQAKENLKIPCY